MNDRSVHVLGTCKARSLDERDIIDIHELAGQLDTGSGCLVDVRGFDEFAASHAIPSICIPISDLERRAGDIPTDRIVYVMCQSGGRSAMAIERLRALGFDNIVDVAGGLNAWLEAGLPTVTHAGVIPLERQVRGIAGALVFCFTVAALLVSRWLLAVPVFVGFMLLLSSVTGFCPMLSILRLMPWNRVLRNVGEDVRQLRRAV